MLANEGYFNFLIGLNQICKMPMKSLSICCNI